MAAEPTREPVPAQQPVVPMQDPTQAQSWAQILDEIEVRISVHESVLENGLPPLDAYQLPRGVGSIPDDLRSRAQMLLDRYLALQERVASARAKIGGALARMDKGEVLPGAAGRERPAAYVDRLG